MDELLEAGVFTKSQVTFDTVYKITLRLPLYGKTPTVNFTRSLSGARDAVGLPPLIYDDDGFKDTSWDIECNYVLMSLSGTGETIALSLLPNSNERFMVHQLYEILSEV